MATKITKIQVRRDTSLNWESVNPILSVGEFALETDSNIPGGRFKIGDGQTDWQALAYFGAGEKGDFNEITRNGPMQNSSFFPDEIPKFSNIDGVPSDYINLFAGSTRGIYTRGLATYHHIFPVEGFTDKDNVVVEPSIGRPDARFSELYVKGNSIHIGDDDQHEVVLSHLRGATEAAVLKIVAVGPGGRVTALEWGRQIKAGLTVESRGMGYRVGQGLSVQYDPNYSVGSQGFGLRINITAVDADGAIQDYEIQDAGGGYFEQELVEIVLRSQLGIARREPFGDTFTVTELATAEGLSQVTSQSLPLVGLGSPAAPYLSQISRSLPAFNGQDQADFNGWTITSLNQLDRDKLQVQNCTSLTGGQGPELRATTGLPVYTLIINNTEGPIHPDFVSLRNTVLKGGEILYFNAQEQWEIVSSAGGDGSGSSGPEEDPIFVASDAYRLVDRNVNGVSTINYEMLTSSGLGGNVEPLMYLHNWDNIRPL